MSLLNSVTTDTTLKHEEDVLGGGRQILESNVYRATVKMAYLEVSAQGAVGLNLTADIAGQDFKETLWITNKDKQTYYIKDGVKNPLKGFLLAEAIALLASNVGILEAKTENKIVKVFNYKTKSEVPTEVEVLVDLLGKEVQLGIMKERNFKREKQDDGSYAEGSETYESNTVSKVFHPTNNKTIAECRAQIDAVFLDEWKAKWAGHVFDRTLGKTPSTAQTGTQGLPATIAIKTPPANSSIFN